MRNSGRQGKKPAHNRGRSERGRRHEKQEISLDDIGTIKLYGDVEGDGAVQLSFTLPMPACDEARVAAQMFAERMGLKNVKVLHMEGMGPEFSFFVVYASSDVEVDVSEIVVPKIEHPQFTFDESNKMIQQKIGRRIVVLGACIGTDAHTVGIDAIFNMKGYMGDYGLERYPMMDAVNMRAQVDTQALVKAVVDEKADAVLVSRVVTQRDSHIVEFKKFLDELKQAEGVPANLIKICGGPRVTHQEALEWGFDAGFGSGTKPSQVASFIVNELINRAS